MAAHVRLVSSACPESASVPYIFLDVGDHVDALPRRQEAAKTAVAYTKIVRRLDAPYELLPIITSYKRDEGTVWTREVPPLIGREFDISFIGGIQYGSNLPSWECKYNPEEHRRDALKVLSECRGRKYVRLTNGKGKHANGEDELSFTEYMRVLRSTKVVVSPWGYGEWCWRDFEAVRAGCVLVKPWCDVVTAPNVYRDGWVEWYRPDHSDLQDKINLVLAKIAAGAYPSRQPMATELLESTRPHHSANVFAAIVKSCAD